MGQQDAAGPPVAASSHCGLDNDEAAPAASLGEGAATAASAQGRQPGNDQCHQEPENSCRQRQTGGGGIAGHSAVPLGTKRDLQLQPEVFSPTFEPHLEKPGR